jgi:hypothetical protein
MPSTNRTVARNRPILRRRQSKREKDQDRAFWRWVFTQLIGPLPGDDDNPSSKTGGHHEGEPPV